MATAGDNRHLKDEIREYWSMRAATFDESPGHEIFSEEERAAWQALFRRHLGSGTGKRALDLASGTGVISHLLNDIGFSVTGIDFAPPMLERAKAKAKSRGASIRFFMGDAEQPMEPDESYDAVVTRHLVWTLPDVPTAFASWFRVLKPGGRLLVVDGDFVNKGSRRPILYRLSQIAKHFSSEPAKPMHDAIAQKEIQSRVYFADGCRADAVEALLAKAGFTEIVVDRKLGAIHRAQGKFLPLHSRLERLAADRFAISARKPG